MKRCTISRGKMLDTTLMQATNGRANGPDPLKNSEFTIRFRDTKRKFNSISCWLQLLTLGRKGGIQWCFLTSRLEPAYEYWQQKYYSMSPLGPNSLLALIAGSLIAIFYLDKFHRRKWSGLLMIRVHYRVLNYAEQAIYTRWDKLRSNRTGVLNISRWSQNIFF